MKAKEIKESLGITQERIKDLKKAGVFELEIPSDKRNREYTKKDLELLQKLTVLSKAGLTITDIKKIQDGEWTLLEAFAYRSRAILQEMEVKKNALSIAEMMMNESAQYETLNTEYYWELISAREAQGDVFEERWETTSPISLFRTVHCPYCESSQEVDLEEFVVDEICTDSRRDNDMGPDIVYEIDSSEFYECEQCGRIFKIHGWVREYPVGAFDSENIEILKLDMEDE